MKQQVYIFKLGEDVPFGAQYLTTEFCVDQENAKFSNHYFLCYVDNDGKPIDAPMPEKDPKQDIM